MKLRCDQAISARRLMRNLLITLLVSLLALLAVLLLLGAGMPKQFVDDAGKSLASSASEKIFIMINGAEQGMFIKSRNTRNPVLLYLHGGMPDHFLTDRYPTGLDEIFTVVWWEQRGSGISFRPDMSPESVNPEQLIADTLALTDYLRARFHQDKIYLMGRSGGTFLGIQAAARAPERYHAYIAVAQISHQIESERLAHHYMLTRYQEQGNQKMAQHLASAPVGDKVPLPNAYLKLRDVAMHELGIGTTRDMKSVFAGMFLSSLLHREYTIGEKINLWRGKLFSGNQLWNTQLSTDLTQKVTRLEIPVYFLHGVYDYTVSYPLAKAYFDLLDAPVKGFYTFQQSAHSPIFEEPQRTLEIMRSDVLTGSNALTDHGLKMASRPSHRPPISKHPASAQSGKPHTSD
jgi:pimeloyl-ACP methyl ester carboxylesterase